MNQNNNYKAWRTKVDEFRGYVKGKLEDIEKQVDDHISGAEKRKEDICDEIQALRDFMVSYKAVQRFKNSLWGALGGGVVSGIAFLVYQLFF